MRGVDKLVSNKDRVREPWGEASSRQGARSHSEALEFNERHPVGSKLTTEQVEDFGKEFWPQGEDENGKELPPLSASAVAERLNAAGNHPRMGDNTFNLYAEPGGKGIWFVRTLQEEVDDSNTIADALRATIRNINSLTRKLRGMDMNKVSETTLDQIYASYDASQTFLRVLAKMKENEQLTLLEAATQVSPTQLGNGHGGQKKLK